MIPVPANTPANTLANTPPANIEDLLTQFAEELAGKIGVSKDAASVQEVANSIRWYQNKAGAVVIVKRGKDRKVLATISPKDGAWSHLYPSWERVLTVLAKEKEAAGVSRLSHDGMDMGEVPQ